MLVSRAFYIASRLIVGFKSKHFFWFSFHVCTHTKPAITSAVDVHNQNEMDPDSPKFITSYQHQMRENLTVVGSAPLVAAEPLSKQHDTENELDGNDGTAVDFVNEAVATVIPVSTIVSTMLSSNETPAFIGGTSMNLQPTYPLQRNRNNTKVTISRNQQNARTAIKSSSPSATANNNTSSQKFHKTDAPMLNYIFDSHLANKHRHYDPRYVSSLPMAKKCFFFCISNVCIEYIGFECLSTGLREK